MWERIRNHKIISIFILIDIITIAIITTFYILNALKSSTLSILVTPSDATITINGKSYHNGTYKFAPGTITATIAKDSFESKDITVELKPHSDTRLQGFLTQPNNDFSYYRTNESEFNILKSVAADDDSAQSFISDQQFELDLKNFLPIQYNNNSLDPYQRIELSISYSTDRCKQKPFCLLVSETFEGHYDFALDLLQKYGYNPSDYEIIYEYQCKQGDIIKCYRL